jgi:hypothetical protein
MSDGSNSNSSSGEQQLLDSAKEEVAACEKEIAAIKAKLRSLGSASSSGDDAAASNNSLKIYWIKVRTVPTTRLPPYYSNLSLFLSLSYISIVF